MNITEPTSKTDTLDYVLRVLADDNYEATPTDRDHISSALLRLSIGPASMRGMYDLIAVLDDRPLQTRLTKAHAAAEQRRNSGRPK